MPDRGVLMKTEGSMKCHIILMTLSVVIFRINKGICSTTEFQIYTNKAAAVPIAISSEEVVSLIHCASLCSSNQLCKSFSLDCFKVLSSRQICKLHSSSVSNVLDLVTSDACYIQKGSAPPTITTATTTAGTPPSTTVIDMVYGPRDMCPSGPSNEDFLVLTTEGVYVYDEITDVTIAPCNGPVPFTSIFQGYPSIPTIEMTKGILISQSTNVELYSGGIVYKWQIESGKLSSVLGSLTYSAQIGTTELDDKDFKWAAYRQGSSIERHFYLGDDQFLLRSNQYGTKTFSKTDKVPDINGFDMNPWSGIPTDTVAVACYGFGTSKDYALVNSSGYVHTYHLDHVSNNNNPTKVLTQQGLIKF